MTNKQYVLDISGHNGEVDFEKVKAAGIYGVMLKCSEGKGYLAPKFKPNYEKALAAGLKVGAYHFLRSGWTTDAAKEGRWFGQCCEGLRLELGLALDVEHEGCNWDAGRDGEPLSATDAYNVVNAFAQNVAKYGRPELYEGKKLLLYASRDYFSRFLTDSDLQAYPKWLANPDKLDFDKPVQMLQYSWEGEVYGVEKAVDLNVRYDKGQKVDSAALRQEPGRFEAGIVPARPESEGPDASKSQPESQPGPLVYRVTGTIGEAPVDLRVEKE